MFLNLALERCFQKKVNKTFNFLPWFLSRMLVCCGLLASRESYRFATKEGFPIINGCQGGLGVSLCFGVLQAKQITP